MKKNTFYLLMILFLILTGTGTYYYLKTNKNLTGDYKLSPRSGGVGSPGEFRNAQRAVDFYRAEIEKKPDNIKNYIELAQLFMQEARVTGHHHEYIPKAQRLIERALEINPGSFEAIITKASLLMTLHQFNKAEELAEKAVAINSYNAFAFGILCDANVELGNYSKAVGACDKMLSIRPDLRSYARASYLREIHGEREASAEAMKRACDAGLYGQENRAWTLYQLGSLFLTEGRLDTAAFIFNGILEERPNYPYALSGLAQINCARNNFPKAIELIVSATQLTPDHIFVEQLADIYKAMNNKDDESEMVSRALDAFEEHEKGGWNVDREYAAFCLNHNINLSEALRRAGNEYRNRPDNIDVLDTYAWALYKNGKAREAIPIIEKAMRLNTQNAAMHYHAGVIYMANKNIKQAFEMLSRSINENPYMSITYADDCKKALNTLRGQVSLK